MFRSLLACAALLLLAGPARAEPEELALLRARSAALERRVEELERLLRARADARVCEAGPAEEAWRRRESWQRLRPGMSRFDAFRLLGEPGVVARYEGFERWEYPDLLGGRLHFDDLGALIGWRLPPALRAAPAARTR